MTGSRGVNRAEVGIYRVEFGANGELGGSSQMRIKMKRGSGEK
jgi:hypothetical protein